MSYENKIEVLTISIKHNDGGNCYHNEILAIKYYSYNKLNNKNLTTIVSNFKKFIKPKMN